MNADAMKAYYENYDEDGRLLTPHGMIEFMTTMRYVERYLKPGARVLDIGAGTGRYSHALARQGYYVDAVELIQHNIDIFHDQTKQGRMSLSFRETRWIYRYFLMTVMMLRCCWGRCII